MGAFYLYKAPSEKRVMKRQLDHYEASAGDLVRIFHRYWKGMIKSTDECIGKGHYGKFWSNHTQPYINDSNLNKDAKLKLSIRPNSLAMDSMFWLSAGQQFVPRNLAVTAKSQNSVTLRWWRPLNSVGYEIQYQVS